MSAKLTSEIDRRKKLSLLTNLPVLVEENKQAIDTKLGLTDKAADSDKLDNLDSTQFLRSDEDDTSTGSLSLTSSGKQYIGGFGTVSTAGVTDWNDVTNARSGNGKTLLTTSSSNSPPLMTSYCHPFNFEYTSKDGTGNLNQMAFGYSTPQLHMRNRYSGTWTPWLTVVMKDSSGNATVTASDSLKLNGVASAEASTVSTIVKRNSSGDINARLFRSEYDTTNSSIGYIMTQIDTATNNYMRPSTKAQVKAGLGSDTGLWTITAPIKVNKADNNVSDHVQFWNGATRIGEIGCEDTNWLRINQETAKNIYTPRSIAAAGNITAYYSDERLKDIDKPIEGALEKIGKWRAVHYHANEIAGEYGYDMDKAEIGLLTQDIEKDFPELITEAPCAIDDDTDYNTLSYDRVTTVLVAALQDQIAINEDLMDRIERLERLLAI